MWNGDKEYWANRNPLLFPHVSAPTNKILNFKGTDYKVNNHGFIKDEYDLRNDAIKIFKKYSICGEMTQEEFENVVNS